MAWQKGVSGNPGGRPRRNAELTELARQHTAAALDALIKIAKTGKSESARVAAASCLLDRGWGKPRQSLEHTGSDGAPIQFGFKDIPEDLSKLSDDELDALANKISNGTTRH
jgi:hypothetical protein